MRPGNDTWTLRRRVRVPPPCHNQGADSGCPVPPRSDPQRGHADRAREAYRGAPVSADFFAKHTGQKFRYNIF